MLSLPMLTVYCVFVEVRLTGSVSWMMVCHNGSVGGIKEMTALLCDLQGSHAHRHFVCISCVRYGT